MSGQLVADIYIRESKDELAEGYSPLEMLKQCRAHALKLGVAVGREVVEQAKRDEYDPPKLMECLARATAGEITHLISWDMFRLTGEAGKHHWFKEQMAPTACSIHYATVEFPESDEGRLQEGIVGLLGGYERAKTRTRTQNGIKGKLADGTPICNARTNYGLVKVFETRRGKKRPVGYARHDEQMLVLERIVREVQASPVSVVCEALNDEGIPAPGGGRWSPGSIHHLLRNPIYAGTYRFGATRQRRIGRGANGKMRYAKEKRAEAEVAVIALEPFVDLGALRAARAALEGRTTAQRARVAPEDDPFTLRGRLACGHCGGALSVARSNGYRRYSCLRAYPPRAARADPAFERCSGPLPQVSADALEREVWRRVVGALADVEQTRRALLDAASADEAARRHAEQVASTRRSVARYRQRIDNGVAELVNPDNGARAREALRAQVAADERTLAEVEDALARLQAHPPVGLTMAGVDALERRLAGIRGKLELMADGAGAVLEREMYKLLHIGVTVGLAEGAGGVGLGRDHRYVVGVDGYLGVLDGEKLPQGYYLRLSTPSAPADDPSPSWSVASDPPAHGGSHASISA